MEQESRPSAGADQRESDLVLEALLLKRVEIYAWLESPAKRANLAAVKIEGHKREVEAA